jgi:hypothetical protein
VDYGFVIKLSVTKSIHSSLSLVNIFVNDKILGAKIEINNIRAGVSLHRIWTLTYF